MPAFASGSFAMLSDEPSELLVERLRRGDERAFGEMLRTHQPVVYRVARRYVRDAADAADVTQRTFIRAHGALGGLRRGSRLRAWLLRIAVNLSLNHLRDRRPERRAELRDDSALAPAVGEERLIAREQRARMLQAVQQLSGKQRLVLELRVFEELSFREIAEVAECSVNSAKVNFHHAVKRLRQLVDAGADGGRA